MCFVSERPSRLHRDDRGRLHCEDGQSIGYPSGWGLYHWHGVEVPADLVLQPAALTVRRIQQETNVEVRRIMLDQFTFDRYVTESGTLPLHADDTGTLYRCELAGDEPLMTVRVTNRTAEPDGTFKHYLQRVDPQLRPLPPGHWPSERQRAWLERQQPQAMTAHNAVASTFGLRGEDYRPMVET